ncbi:2'-5' RNA ligase family protein (plasmid) [Embleya sp. NBC_00888]|uniref:2'-5' RNA ligase family protein n=1 Tax=Embleya sp. NBC_00888 TaxID=2975960 RepID=UPI002F90D826|nr:2'-5' RNA ligase family protein [Embleya sp. NBC_00888]
MNAFPPLLPTDPDAPDTIVANDWSAFAKLTRMSDHWARPDWEPGRRHLYWFLTFAGHRALATEAAIGQQVIAHLGMDPVPADNLHVTLAAIGDARHIPAHAVSDLAVRAATVAGESFTIHAHPMAGSSGAVRFSLSPWTPLTRLRDALARLTPATGEAATHGPRPRPFRPHLGIAYNNTDRPAAPVIRAVAGLRHRAPVRLDIAHVDLVELRREHATYRWDLLHRLPLARPDATLNPGSGGPDILGRRR